MTAEETKIKSPEEIVASKPAYLRTINHWEGTKFKPITKRYFEENDVIQMMQAYHSQFQPQEVSDEEMEKAAKNIAGLIVKRIKDEYDGLLRDAFDAARDGLYDITDVHFKYINFDEWMRSNLTGK